jgi:hypothetical protein
MKNNGFFGPDRCLRAVTLCSLLFVGLSATVADARLIRRGGVTTAAAPTQPGSAVYLLPDTLFDRELADGAVSNPEQSVNAGALADAARFSFREGEGLPFQAHHNWGRYCSEVGFALADTGLPGCYFSLARDDVFRWGGHAVGVPELTPGPAQAATGSEPARPGFSFQWTIQALGEPATSTVLTDAELGAYLTHEQAVLDEPALYRETTGCFAAYHTYDEGGCQFFAVGDSGTLTGQALIDRFGTQVLELELYVSYLAPEGYSFYTEQYQNDPDGSVVFSVGRDPWLELSSLSRPMQIRIGEVSLPGGLPLVGIGLGLLALQRRRV